MELASLDGETGEQQMTQGRVVCPEMFGFHSEHSGQPLAGLKRERGDQISIFKDTILAAFQKQIIREPKVGASR